MASPRRTPGPRLAPARPTRSASKQSDLDAGGGKGIGRQTARQPAADDHRRVGLRCLENVGSRAVVAWERHLPTANRRIACGSCGPEHVTSTSRGPLVTPTPCRFGRQQSLLAFGTPSISANPAVLGHDAVARDDEAHGIARRKRLRPPGQTLGGRPRAPPLSTTAFRPRECAEARAILATGMRYRGRRAARSIPRWPP